MNFLIEPDLRTILYFLNTKGEFDLAKRIINNIESPKYLNIILQHNAGLKGAFYWDETPEGGVYWLETYLMLQQELAETI